MKVTIQGVVVANNLVDYKDKDGQPQIRRDVVLCPEGESTVIKIKCPSDTKLKSGDQVLMTDVNMKPYSFKDEKSGKEVTGISWFWDNKQVQSEKKDK